MKTRLTLLSIVVAMFPVWVQAAGNSDAVNDLAEALQRGDPIAAGTVLQSLSGTLKGEDRTRILNAIERLSPGAEWIYFLQALAEKNQSDAEFIFQVARANWRAGNVEAAIRACGDVVGKSGDNAMLIYQAAALAHTFDRLEEAIRWLDLLLDKNPDHADGLFLQGRILASQGEDEKARVPLERVVEINPKHYLGQYELGRLENRSGNYGKAEIHLRTAVRELCFFTEAYNALLISLARQKKKEDIRAIQEIVNHLNQWTQSKKKPYAIRILSSG